MAGIADPNLGSLAGIVNRVAVTVTSVPAASCSNRMMAVHGDAGEEVISRVAARLRCGPEKITFWRRGLTWYPGGVTQHVWAEPVPRRGGLDAWRVHIRTWCLKRIVGSVEQMHALEVLLPTLSLSALARKPGSPSRLGLAAALHMSVDRVDWTSRVIAAVARLQAYEADTMARDAALRASGAAADIVTEQLGREVPQAVPVPPLDRDTAPPLALDVLPFAEIADALRAHDGVRAIATHSGVTASFALMSEGDRYEFVLTEIRLAEREVLGKGVSITMSLPVPAPTHLVHALVLNEAELQADSPTDVIGGWTLRDGALLHEVFVPPTMCSGEVLRHLAESTARRAAWLRLAGRAIVPGEWPADTRARIIPFRRPS